MKHHSFCALMRTPSPSGRTDMPDPLRSRHPSRSRLRLAGRLALTLTLALSASWHATPLMAQDDMKGLRGADVAAPDTLPAGNYRSANDTTAIERNYEQQPPMVPHKIDGYEITINFNRCMDCHSDERYREMGATKVSQTHFKTREGRELTNISPRRYFCVQCHVPQTDARPLIGNTFQGAMGSR